MKYNKSEIMKAAWCKVRRFGWAMSNALRIAWMEAKRAAMNGRLMKVVVLVDGVEKLVTMTRDLCEAEYNLSVAKRAFCTSEGSILLAD